MQKVMQLVGMLASNPALMSEVKLRPGIKVMVRAAEEDPDDWLLTKEEKAERAQAQQEMEAKQKAEAQQMADDERAAEEEKAQADHRRAREAKLEDFKTTVALKALDKPKGKEAAA